ncbi:hypothetical protein EVG20_g658 [Dentipellis fragilis]|uniref:Mitochondrial distribution and morphology protein 34 n=1 Tax=Dentipellis fragilis TaxID=205917 RepID=A0A4Y9ZDW8_9AGAM|nr:hypothetical protein EVG20_g658 [Dentipellis fragilis]
MSFSFEWPRFSDQFHADAIELLTSALNKGPKPPVIADKIEVVELEMGTQPPELEIRDIGDLTMDQFRGIFRLTYAGDAHLVLRTKVQANPLNHKQHDIDLMSGSRGMLAAKQPLVVPMLLRLSHIRLNAYVVLVVSRQKGITLVFKTDPLQNVDINSTFDSIAVIQKFIQREIEDQLRQMFREDLPGIIHRLSQQWVKATVETPYLTKRPTQSPPSLAPSRSVDPMSMSMPTLPSYAPRFPPLGPRAPFAYPHPSPGLALTPPAYHRSQSASVASTGGSRSVRSRSPPPPAPNPPDSTFPDIENFDPTYGLRPEGLPTKSAFNGFGRLFGTSATRGLADLAEEPGEEDVDEGGSYDMIEWEDTVVTEYETIPAVGGGTITRPRIFHSQSQIQSPSGSPMRPSPTASTSRLSFSIPQTPTSPFSHSAYPTPLSAHPYPRRAQSLYSNAYFPAFSAVPHSASASTALAHPSARSTPPTPPLYHSPRRRASSPDSTHTHLSASASASASVSTPPTTDLPVPITRKRTASVSSALDPEGPTVVLNNAVSQLGMLSHSNRTLSPYTRSLEHFTVRTAARSRVAPPAPAPRRATRRRTHFLGKGKGKAAESPPPEEEVDLRPELGSGAVSPAPTSEFDAGDMDRYFRSRDEFEQHAPAEIQMYPAHLRLRHVSSARSLA